MQVQPVNTPIVLSQNHKSVSLLDVTNLGETAWTKEVTRAGHRIVVKPPRFAFDSAAEQRGIPESPLHD